MLKILLVDDERIFRMSLKSHLKYHFVQEADSFNNAIEKLSKHSFDLCFIDLNLDNSDNELLGFEVLKFAQEKGIYSIIMSSLSEDSIIEHAFQLGCRDFYNKGHEENSVSEILNRFYANRDNYLENYFLNERFPTKSESQILELKKILPVIQTDIPISILGESGTGKTYLAQEIHLHSKRTGSFIAVNCSALSEELLESELFGHSKGSFTGATSDVKGKLTLAHNGTIFLDELGSMSASMQVKLLKAIEEKAFYPVNSDKLVKSNFRIISATLENLEEKIKKGEFRFDLYQRVCGISVTLLPLRKRKEDIADLIKKEIEEISAKGRRFILAKEAKEYLLNYSWRGNLREFKRLFSLLELENSGMIKLEEVKKHLTNELETDSFSTVQFLDKRHYDMAKKMGLNEFINLLEGEIIQYWYSQNNQVIRQTMYGLKINQSKLYKHIKSNDKNSEIFNDETH